MTWWKKQTKAKKKLSAKDMKTLKEMFDICTIEGHSVIVQERSIMNMGYIEYFCYCGVEPTHVQLCCPTWVAERVMCSYCGRQMRSEFNKGKE